MDILNLAQLIPTIAGHLGITPSTLVFYIGVLVLVAKLVARLIPDDATGWQAVVRKIASFIAVDVSNRITKGVSQVDIAKQVVGKVIEQEAHDKIHDLATDAEALIPEVIRDPVSDTVKGLARDSLEAMMRRGEIDPDPDK